MYNIINNKIIPRSYLNVFSIDCQSLSEGMQEFFKDFRYKKSNHKGS